MSVPTPFPAPSARAADAADLLSRHLTHLRGEVVAHITGLPPADRRVARLPSGWSPIELLNHLAHMERRWIRWGFLGEQVADPWGDGDVERVWRVPATTGVADLVVALDDVAATTTEILAGTPLTTPARLGGRFTGEAPTLGSIAFHVLQEYARHLGHLDVVVELSGGPSRES